MPDIYYKMQNPRTKDVKYVVVRNRAESKIELLYRAVCVWIDGENGVRFAKNREREIKGDDSKLTDDELKHFLWVKLSAVEISSVLNLFDTR